MNKLKPNRFTLFCFWKILQALFSGSLFILLSIIFLFISVCDDFGLLKEIFKFPISAMEENEFMSYLDESSSRDAGDLKIMYLLSRGR